MTAHHSPDRSGQLDPVLACDAIRECAAEMLLASVELHTAATIGDLAAVEATLWAIRRALQCATRTWREITPRQEGRAE